MLVTIMSKPVEIQVNTVSIVNNGKPDIYLFRCTRCGTSIAQYRGMIAKIVPIFEPTNDASVIHKCRQCKELYTFQTYRGGVSETRVVLKHDPVVDQKPRQSTEFLCATCRRPVLDYNLSQFFDIYNQTLVDLPYRIKCPYQNCPANYLFTEAV